MKKFLLFLCGIFLCAVCHSETLDISWYVGDNLYTTTQCNSGGDLILPTPPSKPGYNFVGWRNNFQLVEYLESTGTQYIDTGIVYSDVLNARIVLVAKLNEVDEWQGVFRGGSAWGGPFVGFSSGGKFAYSAGTGDELTESSAELNKKYVFDLNIPSSSYIVRDSNGAIFVNKTNIQKHTRSETASGILFGYYGNPNTGNGPYKLRHMTIYACQLYDNGVLVRDFVPVIDAAGVPCMWDKVSETFFYNAGTGNFIAGPVVEE